MRGAKKILRFARNKLLNLSNKGEESEALNRAAFADLWLATNQLGEPRGCVPSVAGRAIARPRRGGREPNGIGRPSAGGKRSCSPSEVTMGQKRRTFEPICLSLQTVFSPLSLRLESFQERTPKAKSSMGAAAISQNLWIFREQSFVTEFGMNP